MSVTFDCFSFTVSGACDPTTNATVPYYNMVTDSMTTAQVEAAAKKLTFEVVNVTLAVIPIAFQMMTASLSDNMIMGVEALQCAMTSGFANVWKLLAAASLVAKEFGMTSYINEGVNQVYPYVCTCRRDVISLSQWLSPNSKETNLEC